MKLFLLISKDKQQDIDVPIYQTSGPTTNNGEVEHLEDSYTSNDKGKSKKHDEKRDLNDAIPNRQLSTSSVKEVFSRYHISP